MVTNWKDGGRNETSLIIPAFVYLTPVIFGFPVEPGVDCLSRYLMRVRRFSSPVSKILRRDFEGSELKGAAPSLARPTLA